jgi:hypothetical protein
MNLSLSLTWCEGVGTAAVGLRAEAASGGQAAVAAVAAGTRPRPRRVRRPPASLENRSEQGCEENGVARAGERLGCEKCRWDDDRGEPGHGFGVAVANTHSSWPSFMSRNEKRITFPTFPPRYPHLQGVLASSALSLRDRKSEEIFIEICGIAARRQVDPL